MPNGTAAIRWNLPTSLLVRPLSVWRVAQAVWMAAVPSGLSRTVQASLTLHLQRRLLLRDRTLLQLALAQRALLTF